MSPEFDTEAILNGLQDHYRENHLYKVGIRGISFLRVIEALDHSGLLHEQGDIDEGSWETVSSMVEEYNELLDVYQDKRLPEEVGVFVSEARVNALGSIVNILRGWPSMDLYDRMGFSDALTDFESELFLAKKKSLAA